MLQNEIFAALAAHPPTLLISLTLNNLIAIPNKIYANEDFHQIFRSLQELNISMLSNIDSNGSHYYQNALAEFCDDDVAHMARSATALTARSIRSGQRADVRPVLAFKDILHPHLMSLALTSSGWILVFQTWT
jgi:hypothetical protein